MVILFLAGWYAALLPLGFGVWCLKGINATFRPHLQPVSTPPLLVWFMGLALLTAALETWSLLGPVHTAAHLTATGVGVAGLALPAGRLLLRRLWQQTQNLHRTVLYLGILLIVGALLISCLPPLNVDTGLYHAQAIRWIEELGVVRGLANINVHLGYNPSWFVPEALFSWGRYVGSPLQVLNMVVFCLFGLYGLAGLDHVLRHRFRPVDVLRVLLAAVMILWLLPDMASLSPDPAAAILAFFLILQGILLPTPSPNQRLQPAHVVVFLLCIFAVKIKLAAAPLLLLPVWWLYNWRQAVSARFVALAGVWAVLLLAPWLARNLLISGYLVFPVTALDFFSFDWKFPADEMQRHVDYIRDFARNEEFYHEISVHGKPMSFWLPLWWHRQSLNDKLLTMVLPLLLAGALPLAVRQFRQHRLPQAAALARMLAVALAGVLFWFVMAPSFRFGYGFLLSSLCLLSLPLVWQAATTWPQLMAQGLTGLVASIMIVLVLSIEYRNFLVPPILQPHQYSSLSQRVQHSPDLPLLQASYKFNPNRQVFLLDLPAHEKPQYALLLFRHDGGATTQGLLNMSAYLWQPAAYPTNQFQPFQLGELPLLRVVQEDIPWYAAFPFVARPRFCYPRGPQLADGFRPRPVANVRDWQYEASW